MVAKIITGKSMRGALIYNERKVEQDRADLLLASGFGMDVSRLGFYDKLNRFQALTSLAEKIKTNTLHISLNFSPEEKIEPSRLQDIVLRYMDLIGFAEQPFLVYQHRDAGHDHLHIVTTQVQPDGIPIALNDIGRTVSEPARRLIEEEFGLIRATRQKRPDGPVIPSADLDAARYGQTETKKAISNIILAVSRDYLYTSITEFNAVLEQFNVTCERGDPGTRQYEHGGLTYSLTDDNGAKIGVPIKASLFYCQPTLKNLEKHFSLNLEKRRQYKDSIVSRIESVLEKYERLTRETFLQELGKLSISARFARNTDGRYYGVTFTDHRTKAVFKGSDLGKLFAAEALITGFSTRDKLRTYLATSERLIAHTDRDSSQKSRLSSENQVSLLDQLLEKSPLDFGPTTLPKRKRKRRRPGLSR